MSADLFDGLPPADELPPPVEVIHPPADTAEQRLARALAHQVRRWSLRLQPDDGAAQAAAEAAQALSLAASDGHVGIALSALATEGDLDGWRQRLLASAVVGGSPEGDAPDPLPLVIDAHDRLYLHRHFDQERRLARRLVAAANAPPSPPSPAARALLRELFPRGHEAVDWQQLATALALRQRLTVISGGPGTGKTTTVVALLGCLLADDPDCRIALAAPTGKAAARLGEALRERGAALPPALRERLPAEATTLHRLLGARPDGFTHHAANPLPVEALVVDEASMLDLSLAARLLDAVPPTARLVLLGDKDQLAAVEAGAVFAELSADAHLSVAARRDLADACGLPADALPPAATVAGPLVDSTVWFQRNFRFSAGSAIGRLAGHLKAGEADGLLQALRSADGGDLRWHDDRGEAPSPAVRRDMADGFAAFAEALRRDPGDVAGASAAFASFRVLCALREGPRGTAAVNASLTRWLRERLQRERPDGAGDPRSPWFTGRPVMVLRNDPVLRLFNGDIGITLPDADGRLMVHVPLPDGGFRALPPQRLPEHDTAFAMTVHKSQGSEFDRVLVLLPHRPHRVASRELLYTAVTRARRGLSLAAPADVVQAAVRSPTRRDSGLRDRLAEAAAGAPNPSA
ncbi:exodeoxyribonuclease V subunit alpha [Aquabacterium sp. J223]|uniref:exodeoxyribonuclease V subunit alpha n=1 Tax=Aquabacterium sp. J223 TaxID=2898431 RepID=UPI0021AE0672|nr:exodeoxyribonuclease V subunit alpha [Aquabacterium sp. J223]UUX94245.1 exodeoxyribonuclease V subunit alpha [Aquabacterium sp. J223]